MYSCMLCIPAALSPQDLQWHFLLFWKMLGSVACCFYYFNYLRVASATFNTCLNKNSCCEQDKVFNENAINTANKYHDLENFQSQWIQPKTEYKYLFSWKFAALGFIILSYPYFNFHKYAQKPRFDRKERSGYCHHGNKSIFLLLQKCCLLGTREGKK